MQVSSSASTPDMLKKMHIHTNLIMCRLRFSLVLQWQVLNLRRKPIDLRLRLLHICRYSVIMNFISTLVQFSLQLCHATPQPLTVLFKCPSFSPPFTAIPPPLEKQTDYHCLEALQLRVEIDRQKVLQLAPRNSRVCNLDHLRSRGLRDLCAHLL